jgi:uncharacterized protein
VVMEVGATLRAARRQHDAPSEAAHRPWPLPDGPWFMAQSWEKLLFAHWRVPEPALRAVVPSELPIDSFDGSAWIGVTPFRVRALRLRSTPPVPGLSSFCEVNVRTYVTVGDRPGIYFLSLDAESRLAVRAARRTYRLPYFKARMAMSETEDGSIEYRSERADRSGPAAGLDWAYRADGPESVPRKGALDHFLTERYCLYTFDDRRRVQRAEIHHPPWRLRPASGELRRNTMATPFRIRLDGSPLLHLAAPQDVVLWPIAEAT